MDDRWREKQRLPWARALAGAVSSGSKYNLVSASPPFPDRATRADRSGGLVDRRRLTAVGLNLVPVNQSAPRQSRQFAGAVNLVDAMVVALLERRAWPADCSRAGWQTLSV